MPPEGFPTYHCCDQSQRQTNISEANMNLFVTSYTRSAIFETLLVFFDRRHRLRIHQKILDHRGIVWNC